MQQVVRQPGELRLPRPQIPSRGAAAQLPSPSSATRNALRLPCSPSGKRLPPDGARADRRARTPESAATNSVDIVTKFPLRIPYTRHSEGIVIVPSIRYFMEGKFRANCAEDRCFRRSMLATDTAMPGNRWRCGTPLTEGCVNHGCSPGG